MRISRSTNFGILRRLLGQARAYRPHLAALVVLSLLPPALRLLAPLPLKIAVDSVLGDQPPPAVVAALVGAGKPGLLAFAAGLLVTITFLGLLLGLAAFLLSTYAGEKLVLRFRAALFGHALRLSLSYHDTQGTTDSTYRIQDEAPAIRWILIDAGMPLLAALLTLVTMVAVIGWINVPLALVALAVSPVMFLLSRVYGRRLRKKSAKLKGLESASMAVVQEVLGALRVVKAFGQEDREQERFVAKSAAGLNTRLQVALASGGLALLVGLTTAVGTAAVLFIGVGQVQAGTLTLGELLVVMAYLAQLYAPLETISTKLADLQASLVSAERCLALLDEGPDVVDRPDARPLGRAVGAVSFRDVSFGYSAERQVLHGVSFEVPAGARVGIAGATGAGKTTLLSLLTRFYDPAAGQVLIDGVDLRDYRLADLRRQFGIVLQEPVLFSASIGENIAYAKPGTDADEIVAAAKAANVHDFIAGLPRGYDTPVGERGLDLSGGERQRISLARAFLKDAPILILDEPTSSVDVKTEAAIMDALRRLMEGRTTFIIAHRLGTLEGCDVRLHVERGRVAVSVPGGRTPERGPAPRPSGAPLAAGRRA
jgi:ATP-binding cassette, subfamily B, bacterial